MLHSLDLRNVHQATERLFIENLTVRSEHASQFKCQHEGISPAHRLVDRGLVLRRLTMQARALEQDRLTPEAQKGNFFAPDRGQQHPPRDFRYKLPPQTALFGRAPLGPSAEHPASQ